MSRDIAPFGVRMPPELKGQIEQAASASGRSLNAEVVYRLQTSFDKPRSGDFDLTEVPSEELLKEFIERFSSKIRIEILEPSDRFEDKEEK
jgi:hypothetical protein